MLSKFLLRLKRIGFVGTLIVLSLIISSILSQAWCDDPYSEVINSYRTRFKWYAQVEKSMQSPYSLWAPDKRISEVEDITKEKTANGFIFNGYDQNGNRVQARFRKTEKMAGELILLYKGKEQLRYSEYFTKDHKVHLSIECPLRPEYYLKIIVTDPDTAALYSSTKRYLMQIETMGKIMQGEGSASMNRLPVLDRAIQLKETARCSPVKIAALNRDFLNWIIEEYDLDEWPQSWWAELLNIIAASSTDLVGGPAVTIGAHVLSFLIVADPAY